MHLASSSALFAVLVAGALSAPSSAQGSLQALPPTIERVIDLSFDGSSLIGTEADDSDPNYILSLGRLLSGNGTVIPLAAPAGFDSVFPAAISHDGLSIVGVVRSSVSLNFSPARWNSAGAVSLINTGNSFDVVGISGDGRFAIGSDFRKAARWGPLGATEFLDDFPAVVTSTANAANFDGSVVVGEWRNAINLRRPFRWLEGVGMMSLPLPLGFEIGTALAVSDDGAVIFGEAVRLSNSAVVIWRWTEADGLTVLPGQNGPSERLKLIDVDASGDRVLGFDFSVMDFDLNSTVWEAQRPPQDFLGFLTSRGVDPLSVATRRLPLTISGDGHIFAGSGVGSNAMPINWIADTGFRSGIQSTTCTHGTLNQSGAVSRLFIDGVDLAAANEVTLRAADLPPGAFTLFVTSQVSMPPMIPPGSIGALCLGGALGRYARPGEVRAADAAGTVTLDLDLGVTPTPSGPTAVLAGQTWHYQGWHRDVAQGQATANFTDAVNVTYR